MLRERAITAAVLLLVFIVLLAFTSIEIFALAISCVVAIAAWEWSRLCGVTADRMQSAFAVLVGTVSLLLLYSPLADGSVRWVLLLGLLFWISVPVQFYLKPVLSSVNGINKGWLLVGVLVLPIAAVAIFFLRHHAPQHSSWLLLYALTVVWVMDIGAYFTGRKFGKRKLAPLISPGKSWEGVYGGLACAAVLFVLVSVLGQWPEGTGLMLFLATVFSAAASVVGDLFESRLKRAAGMKDSSQLLPGHGGVLDRIDGVIAALPVFAFFWAQM